MTHCPYCKKRCNPLRFYFYNNRRGYLCPNCKKKSVFQTKSLYIFGALFGGIAGYCGGNIYRYYDGSTLLLYAVIGILAVSTLHVLTLYLFLELSPMPKPKKSSPLPWSKGQPIDLHRNKIDPPLLNH